MVSQKKSSGRQTSLTSVMEDYLEAIFELYSDEAVRAIRVKDIAGKLDVKMPTVTSMLRVLKERGLVEYEKYEYVDLTERGKTVGREIKERHYILKKFLTDVLHIDDKTADSDACRMEHALSGSTMESLTSFMAFIQACPRAGDDWVGHFQAYQHRGRIPSTCRERFENFMVESAGSETFSGTCCSKGDNMKLSKMKEGQRGRIIHVGGEIHLRRRIMEMGLSRGAEFYIEKYAPLKDPLELSVNGNHVSLRVKEADEITVAVDGNEGD